MRKKLLAVLFFWLSLGTGCAQILAGLFEAAQGAAPISREQTIAIGNAAAQQVLSTPGNQQYTDPKVNAYLTKVGQKVVQGNWPWQFFILDSPQENAFALPGGKIFVYTGLLRMMENEAQLAGVLAHESAHVVRGHGLAQMRRIMVARGILIGTLGTSPAAAQLAGQIAAELVLRGYGRDAELEADQYGVVYAAKADYDPRQLEVFLRKLTAGGRTPSWIVPLSTHPTTDERVKRIEQTITQERLQGSLLNRDPFLAGTAPLQ